MAKRKKKLQKERVLDPLVEPGQPIKRSGEDAGYDPFPRGQPRLMLVAGSEKEVALL